jgi:hypothetical protein
MAFNLVEAEGLQEYWDEIEEPKREKPKNYDMDYTNFEMSLALERFYEPAQYECYRGWRFPEF